MSRKMIAWNGLNHSSDFMEPKDVKIEKSQNQISEFRSHL